MDRGTKILLIGTVILVLVLTFFAYLVGIIPQVVMKVDEKDFDILKIEYTAVNTLNNETFGAVKLSIKTNRDNLIISAHAGGAKYGGFCANEFEKAGFHTLEGCRGDPSYSFDISPVNKDYNFTVCAVVPWSQFYEREPACKWILLPPYQE